MARRNADILFKHALKGARMNAQPVQRSRQHGGSGIHHERVGGFLDDLAGAMGTVELSHDQLIEEIGLGR